MAHTNNIPEGYKETEFGPLPEEWKIDQLGNIAEIQVGYSFASAEFLEQEAIDTVPIIRIRDLVLGNPGTFIKSPKEQSIYQDFLVNSCDILIGMDGNFHTVRWSGTPGLLNQRISRVKIISQNANDDFIFYFIINPIKEIENSKHFTTVKHLSNKDLMGLPIPLPPLPEQHAIATTLRTVQEAKENTDTVIAATKALKAAMMKHLFTYGPVPPEEAERVALKETEIGPVPEEWEIRTVNELFDSKLGKMLSPISKTGKFSKPYLRNANVQWGRVDISDLYEMDFSENSYDRYALIFGDILICEGGEIGRTAIWRDEIKECYYQKAIHRLRPRDGRISPEFFSYHMMYAFLIGKTYSELGTTTTIAHLPGMKLKALLVPVPPRDVQDKIVTILESIDQKLAAEQSRKEALDTLFASLLHDLMTAKIRVCTA